MHAFASPLHSSVPFATSTHSSPSPAALHIIPTSLQLVRARMLASWKLNGHTCLCAANRFCSCVRGSRFVATQLGLTSSAGSLQWRRGQATGTFNPTTTRTLTICPRRCALTLSSRLPHKSGQDDRSSRATLCRRLAAALQWRARKSMPTPLMGWMAAGAFRFQRTMANCSSH